jgi:hypothetical protein
MASRLSASSTTTRGIRPELFGVDPNDHFHWASLINSEAKKALASNTTNAIPSAGSHTRMLPMGGNKKTSKIRLAAAAPRIADARPHRNAAAKIIGIQNKGAASLLSGSPSIKQRRIAPQAQKAIPEISLKLARMK